MYFFYYSFWISISIVFYTYFGYGILLGLLTGIRVLFKNSESDKLKFIEHKDSLPEVTVIVAAYNEETIIGEKITNCLSLNYPADKISFLFITDGSTDRTPTIVARYPQIRLLHRPSRKGKTAALNRAMSHVKTPITVFCDANTILNRSAIIRIVRHYQDPNTGGVAGEKKVLAGQDLGTAATGEGLYWKYESLLKKLDAELYTVTGAAGELFSIRTALWQQIPEDTILDDFIISTNINIKGYRIAYEPTAYARELPSASIDEEKKRKIRISAGAFQAMTRIKQIFNVFKHPILCFQFCSHRIFRWTLTPISLPILLVSNIILVAHYRGLTIYTVAIVGQAIFYGMAIAGALLKSKSRLGKCVKVPYYVLFMNYAVYIGFIRFIEGGQTAIWEKAERQIATPIYQGLS